MNIKSVLLLLLLFTITTNCNSQKILRLAKKGYVTQSDYYSAIPFQYENKHIFIDVEINGEIYYFLFDSGADFSVIDPSFIKNLDYKKVAKVGARGSSIKAQKAELVELSAIRISNVEFKSIGAALMDLSFINNDYPCSPRPIVGVIGANILRKSNWQIDFANKKIVFSDNLNNLNLSSKVIELKIIPKSWGSPFANLNINGVKKTFRLDTGSSGSITTGTEFRKELNKTNKNVNYTSITRSDKQKIKFTNYYAQIEQISFGEFKLNDQLISLENGVSSLIGNEFLENYRITFDWKNNKLLLDSINKVIEQSFVDYEILLKPNFSNNRIEISGIYNLELSSKDYEIGTLIVTIDEIDVSKFSQDELCDFWKNTWSNIQLKGKITVVTEKGVIELVKKNYINN
jgi:predicted aspartyl protease